MATSVVKFLICLSGARDDVVSVVTR